MSSNRAGAEPAHASRTAPAVRLAQITDIHLGSPGPSGMVLPSARVGPLLATAVDQLNDRPDLDAVVVTGDLIDGGQPAALDEVIAALNRLRAPWFAIPGNHDIAHPAGAAAHLLNRRTFYERMQAGTPAGAAPYAEAATRGSWSALIKPGVRLIGLDSNVPGDW